MYTRVFEVRLNVPVERVWEFHVAPDSLAKLSPPSMGMKMLTSNPKLEEGALHEFKVKVFGFPVTWKARISQVTPPHGFTDYAEKSPFAFWRHRHDFIPDGEGTLVRDVVVYELPYGKLGRALHKWKLEKQIAEGFKYRQEVLKNLR